DAVQNLWNQVGDVLEEIDKEDIKIENLGNSSVTLQNSLQASITSFRGHQSRTVTIIEGAMKDFRREYPDEGASLTEKIDSLGSFERIFHQLETDDLPKYEERFKQMLDRTVTRGIQVFSSHLTEQERAIDRS